MEYLYLNYVYIFKILFILFANFVYLDLTIKFTIYYILSVYNVFKHHTDDYIFITLYIDDFLAIYIYEDFLRCYYGPNDKDVEKIKNSKLEQREKEKLLDELGSEYAKKSKEIEKYNNMSGTIFSRPAFSDSYEEEYKSYKNLLMYIDILHNIINKLTKNFTLF